VNNKNVKGESFSAELIQKVWEKAQVIDGKDPQRIRRDLCGAIIHRELFGKTSANLSGGWEIDHIKPLTQGGTDDFLNLQPLQWVNNRNKGNQHPSWKCLVCSADSSNQYLKE
jgi:5-methylcytosine-specific restriction endonuclease McrA